MQHPAQFMLRLVFLLAAVGCQPPSDRPATKNSNGKVDFVEIKEPEGRMGEVLPIPEPRYPACEACQQGLGWDGRTEHVEGCPERVPELVLA